MALRALPYQGGKSAAGPYRMAQWLNSQLPEPGGAQRYIEPYAGMASVLLNREPVGFEMLNDADCRLINWWRVLQDRPVELHHLLAHTPRSRAEYERAHQLLGKLSAQQPTDPEKTLRWAWAYTVVVEQSVQHHANETPRSWHFSQHRYAGEVWGRRWSLVNAVSERIAAVHFECEDALTVLQRFAADPKAVIYCDPPYPNTRDPWRLPGGTTDTQHLIAVLLDNNTRAQIAVSGYARPSTWPQLDKAGWRCVHRTPIGSVREAVWVNYELPTMNDNCSARLSLVPAPEPSPAVA